MNREKADRWLGVALVALILTLVLCGVMFTGMVRPQDFLIAQGLAIPILLLWVARLWTRKEPGVLWPPVCWFGAIFVVYAIIRTFGADLPYIARSELLRILVYTTTFFVALQSFHSRGALRALLWTLVGLGTASSVYAIYQSAIDPDHVWHFTRPEEYGYGRRGSGFFINPNNLAIQLAMTAPLALAYAVLSRQKAATKVALGGAALIMAVGIALTMSRGGWIATTMALTYLVIVVVRMRGRRAAVIGSVAMLVGLGTFVVSQSELAKVRLEAALSREASGNFRYAVWETAWSIWRDHKMLGAGPGHFDRRYREYRVKALQHRPIRAHNDYIDALADWGVVGLGIGLGGVAALLVAAGSAWRSMRRRVEESGAHRSDRLAAILGLTCAAIAWLFHILFDFPSHIPGLAMLAACLAAALAAQIRNISSKYRLEAGFKTKVGLTAAAMAMALCLGWQGSARYREFRALEASDNQAGTPEESVAFLMQAHAIEPTNPDTPFIIGETFRLESWENPPDYAEKSETAMRWFEKAIELDPFDPVRRLRLAQCLDWLDRPEEASARYEEALKLDPWGFHTARVVAWHFAHLGELETARIWYDKSVYLQPGPVNTKSWEQLRMIEEALQNDR